MRLFASLTVCALSDHRPPALLQFLPLHRQCAVFLSCVHRASAACLHEWQDTFPAARCSATFSVQKLANVESEVAPPPYPHARVEARTLRALCLRHPHRPFGFPHAQVCWHVIPRSREAEAASCLGGLGGLGGLRARRRHPPRRHRRRPRRRRRTTSPSPPLPPCRPPPPQPEPSPPLPVPSLPPSVPSPPSTSSPSVPSPQPQPSPPSPSAHPRRQGCHPCRRRRHCPCHRCLHLPPRRPPTPQPVPSLPSPVLSLPPSVPSPPPDRRFHRRLQWARLV